MISIEHFPPCLIEESDLPYTIASSSLSYHVDFVSIACKPCGESARYHRVSGLHRRILAACEKNLQSISNLGTGLISGILSQRLPLLDRHCGLKHLQAKAKVSYETEKGLNIFRQAFASEGLAADSTVSAYSLVKCNN